MGARRDWHLVDPWPFRHRIRAGRLEPYFEAIRTGKPHYGHVRALFAVDEAEPDWVSYQRLILPYDAARWRKAVSIMVVPDQDVSIPFLRPDKTDGVDG